MAQYRWLTATDDAYPGAHENPPLGVDTIGNLAEDMRKVKEVADARELRDELTAWLIRHPNRGTGSAVNANATQPYRAVAISLLQKAMESLDAKQQHLWVEALDDPGWGTGR